MPVRREVAYYYAENPRNSGLELQLENSTRLLKLLRVGQKTSDAVPIHSRRYVLGRYAIAAPVTVQLSRADVSFSAFKGCKKYGTQVEHMWSGKN